jgi:hypothetical protein
MSDAGPDRFTEVWNLWARMVDETAALAARAGFPSPEIVEFGRGSLRSLTTSAQAAIDLASALTTPVRAAGSPPLPRVVAGQVELQVELNRGLGGSRLWSPGIFQIGGAQPQSGAEVTPASARAGSEVTVRYRPNDSSGPHAVHGEVRNELNELVATFSDLIT